MRKTLHLRRSPETAGPGSARWIGKGEEEDGRPWRELAILVGGMAGALMVVALGLGALAGENSALGQATVQERAIPKSSPDVSIAIEGHHLGNLKLDLHATVMQGAPKQPLAGAKVVAFLDMVDMPRAHAMGPLLMEETPDQPGRYRARSAVPMPGSYQVRVDVLKPFSAQEQSIVSVGVERPR